MKYIILPLLLLSLPSWGVFGLSNNKSSSERPAGKNEIVLTSSNHITFSGEVNGASVGKASLDVATKAAFLSASEPLYLIIDSPGGSVTAGNKFIDFVKSVHPNVKPFCSFCASMGYHFFQSFGERLVSPSSELMSHRASLGGIQGQVPGEFESRLNSIKATLLDMDTHVAKRVGTSLEDYRKLIYDELWINGTNAVKIKHADRLVNMRCSRELMEGRETKYFQTWVGTVEAVFSTCPLVSYPLSAKLTRVKVMIDGKAPTVTESQLIEIVSRTRKTSVKMTY